MKRNRGRPPVDPEIMFYIEERVRNNRYAEPDKKRLNKELARDLEKEIPQQINKPSPTFGTLLKKISEVSEDDPASIDRTWSLLDIPRYPITPEALLTVLKVWAYEQVTYNRRMTIRQALWVNRISSVYGEAGLNEKPGLISDLAGIARSLTHAERIVEQEKGRGVKLENIYGWDIETHLFELIAGKNDSLTEQFKSLKERE